MTEQGASRPGSRGEQKERTRRAILDAALDLSDRTSLVALSLRQVAKEVGIVPTAFYRHFASIESLGLALVDESFVSLRAMLRDVRRGDRAFDDVVDRSITVLVEHVHQQRAHFLFIARERAAGPRASGGRSRTRSSSSSGSSPPTWRGCPAPPAGRARTCGSSRT
jgi:AcrR family transcriptional regulator